MAAGVMTGEAMPNAVLVVDDDHSFRSTLARAFQRRGWEVRQAANVVEALARAESPEYAVVDLSLPVGDGLTVVREFVSHDAATCTVLLTGFASIATAIAALRAAAVHYRAKPADVGDIIAVLHHGSDAAPPPIVGRRARRARRSGAAPWRRSRLTRTGSATWRVEADRERASTPRRSPRLTGNYLL
jgi:two-component system response regulator RegA